MNKLGTITQFFSDNRNTPDVWFEYLKNYKSIPNKSKDTEKFIALDMWYQTLDLGKGYVTHSELIQIMDWKLTRGKMRPLLNKIKNLDQQIVVNATATGLDHIKDTLNINTDVGTITAAINAVCEPLNGVGPATASAVLARYNLSIPFMSDAGLIAVGLTNSKGKLDYTVATYIKYYTAITNKVNQLNQINIQGINNQNIIVQNNYVWTAWAVELVLHMVYSHSQVAMK